MVLVSMPSSSAITPKRAGSLPVRWMPEAAVVVLGIALFGLLVWRAFAIGAAAQARDARFAAYSAYGIGLWLGLQSFVNLGVNVGLLPTKGLTLPFLSYGSNSLIVGCAAVGLLLRIQRENRDALAEAGGGKWQRA